MLNDKNGVPQVAQAAQERDQPLRILRMQSSCGLIQNIDHAGQLRSQGGRKLQPLQFSAGKGGNGTAAGQIAKPQSADAFQLGGKIRQVVLHQLSVGGRQRTGQSVDPVRKGIQRKLVELRQSETVHHDFSAFLLQPFPAAGRTGGGLKIGFQFAPFFSPVVQPAKENRFQSLKPSAGYGPRRLFFRKGPDDFRSCDTLIQKGLLQRIKPKDRETGRNGKAVIPAGGIKGFGLVFAVFCLPEADSPVFQGPGLVNGCSPVEGQNLPHSFADRTGPFLRIERKIGGGELFHFLSAFPAVLVDRKFFPCMAGTGRRNHFLPAVRRRNRLPAVGTDAHTQLLIEHPKPGIEIRYRAHRGAGIAVLVGLGDHDGGRGVLHALHRRPGDSLEGHGFQILPLTFHVQNVD